MYRDQNGNSIADTACPAAKTVGFIGAGKVGFSFGRHIGEHGGGIFEVGGYFSRDTASARAAATLAGGRAYDTAAELAAVCDLLFITVPDGLISDVWEALYPAINEGQNHLSHICHCSGSLGAEVFRSRPSGLSFGSIHPLLAVPDRENSYRYFEGAFFTIEGDESFKTLTKELLTTLGNPFCEVDAAQKTLYHAACVMVSNLVCALTYKGTEVFKACGLEDSFSESAWSALFLENAKNIAASGPVRALTGPVERGDTATVARHLDTLSGDTRELYLLLSRSLAEVAQKKNPKRDYAELASLLGLADA